MQTASLMLRFLAGHGIVGGGAGLAMGAGLLFFDVAGLATLSTMSEPMWLGPFLLCFSFFASFSALAMGAAVMSFGDDGNGRGPDDGETVQIRMVPEPDRLAGGPAEIRVKSSGKGG